MGVVGSFSVVLFNMFGSCLLKNLMSLLMFMFGYSEVISPVIMKISVLMLLLLLLSCAVLRVWLSMGLMLLLMCCNKECEFFRCVGCCLVKLSRSLEKKMERLVVM